MLNKGIIYGKDYLTLTASKYVNESYGIIAGGQILYMELEIMLEVYRRQGESLQEQVLKIVEILQEKIH